LFGEEFLQYLYVCGYCTIAVVPISWLHHGPKAAMYYNSTVCSNLGLIPGAHHRQVWYLSLLPLIFLPLGTTFRRRIYILLIGDFELLCSPVVVPCMTFGEWPLGTQGTKKA